MRKIAKRGTHSADAGIVRQTSVKPIAIPCHGAAEPRHREAGQRGAEDRERDGDGDDRQRVEQLAAERDELEGALERGERRLAREQVQADRRRRAGRVQRAQHQHAERHGEQRHDQRRAELTARSSRAHYSVGQAELRDHRPVVGARHLARRSRARPARAGRRARGRSSAAARGARRAGHVQAKPLPTASAASTQPRSSSSRSSAWSSVALKSPAMISTSPRASAPGSAASACLPARGGGRADRRRGWTAFSHTGGAPGTRSTTSGCAWPLAFGAVRTDVSARRDNTPDPEAPAPRVDRARRELLQRADAVEPPHQLRPQLLQAQHVDVVLARDPQQPRASARPT